MDPSWNHLNGLQLADPDFGCPGSIDVLLGVDVFVGTVLQGRRAGPPGSPAALETEFGWVLAGSADHPSTTELVSHHVSLLSGDELLRKFWEVEEAPQFCPPRKGPLFITSKSTIIALQREGLSFLCPGRLMCET
jgi:hypothetical protein